MLSSIRNGLFFGIGIAFLTIAAIPIPTKGINVQRIETLIQSIESSSDRKQVQLQAIEREIRDSLQEFEDIKEQLLMQQRSLALETMLESSGERHARLNFDEQLRALNEKIPPAEIELKEQEQKTFLYTAAPDDSDVMMDLKNELNKRQTNLAELKSQYLDLIHSQKIIAESLTGARNTFMRNWWELENYLESNYSSVRDYLDDQRKQYENLKSKILLEKKRTAKLRTQLKRIR